MFAVENALMNPSTFFDWPFFILLSGIGIASVSTAHLQAAYARLDYLPSWLRTFNAASLIVAWINVTLAWADLIVGIYGFLILPWYTVLICMAADLIVGAIFSVVVLNPVIRRFGVFIALLISYVIAAIAVIWYCGYAGGLRPITLNLGAYIGIAVLICYKIVAILRARRTPKSLS